MREKPRCDELLIDVAREHVEARGSAHLRDPRAHLPETDDSDALDGHGVRSIPRCSITSSGASLPWT